MDGKSGQGAAVVLIVAIVAAVVAGAIVYFVMPTPEPPEVAELEEQISDLEAEIDDLEATIVDLQGQIPTPLDTIKVAFVCHGNPADACWIAYHNGAEALAERLRNVEVVYRYSVEDIVLQVDMVREEIARGVDAIVISIADANALDDPIQEARDAGIVVIAYDCDDPEGAVGNARQAFITSSVTGGGLCYDTGYLRGLLVGDYGVPAGGNIFFPNEGPGATWSEDCKRGFLDGLAEKGYTKDVDFSLHEIEATYSVETAQELITAYLVAHPETDILVPCGGCTSIASVLAEEALGMAPGELPIWSWPHGDADARGIETGLVIAGVTDSHSSVGAIALYEAVMAVQFNFGPVDVTMPLVVVDETNIDLWGAGWRALLY
ncbi:MAG: substrate-binding domain-containing protein [Hadesarchaea archaeon]|nr:substrate-binding domain-containing protein [Hadesarchaea archaeon]MDH5685254.1 substrate-binding domain-containing protein [Hadesarchaea archaeon]